MPLLLHSNGSVLIQAPPGTGKSVALIAAAIAHINNSNPALQAVLVCANIEAVEYTWKYAKSIGQNIRVSKLHHQIDCDVIDGHILVGTCQEVINLFDVNKELLSSLQFVGYDDADLTAMYKKLIDFGGKTVYVSNQFGNKMVDKIKPVEMFRVPYNKLLNDIEIQQFNFFWVLSEDDQRLNYLKGLISKMKQERMVIFCKVTLALFKYSD